MCSTGTSAMWNRWTWRNRTLLVNFDDRLVEYEASELDELTLAYATTIHKSQGSEYPIVVMPVLMTHYVMLQRNLIYTGITRAQEDLRAHRYQKGAFICHLQHVSAETEHKTEGASESGIGKTHGEEVGQDLSDERTCYGSSRRTQRKLRKETTYY